MTRCFPSGLRPGRDRTSIETAWNILARSQRERRSELLPPLTGLGGVYLPGVPRSHDLGYESAALRASGGDFRMGCPAIGGGRSSHLRLPPPIRPRLILGAEPGLSLLRGDDRLVVPPLAGEVVDALALPGGDVPFDDAAGRRVGAASGAGSFLDLDRRRGGRSVQVNRARGLRVGRGCRRWLRGDRGLGAARQEEQGGHEQEGQEEPELRGPESRSPAPPVDPMCDVFDSHGSSLKE